MIYSGRVAQAEKWADYAAEQLAQAGYRRGEARSAVLALLDSQQCALSAQDIKRALSEGGRTVARASVYRILDELVELRLLSSIDVGQGITRYEPIRPGGHHHHHMACRLCGGITPFEDKQLEDAIERVAGQVTFAVDEHEIVLHGLCRDCSATPSDDATKQTQAAPPQAETRA
jgi:Fur family ferric uptake transcriptional regulator